VVGSASAQGAKGGKASAARDEVELEIDDSGGGASGPVAAGQMTEEAAQAKRLFDGGKWAQASLALDRVYKGETGDDEGNKQIAHYNLAIALYQLKLYQASYNQFSLIADNPNHLKFNETLLWLSKLATQLPEPADIVERVGRYKTDALEQFNNPARRELYWQLNYLLGRYKYRNRQYEEAIACFQKVKKDSTHFVQAQFFMGISHVQKRQSVPAVKAFQRIVEAVDKGVKGVEDEQRMRDLAYLSMARTYYTASVGVDDSNNPVIEPTKLNAAVRFWNSIDMGSEYWLDGLFEESWAYFMAGEYPRALGNIHTINSPFFPNAFYPEAEILKAVIYFANCQYKETTTVVARFNLRYEPIKKELQKILAEYKGDGGETKMFEFMRKVRDGKANLDPKLRPIVENSLSDRQLLRNLEYVRVLEDEEQVFKKTPATFRNSPLGGDVQDALDLAKELAVRNAGELARARFQRTVEELEEHLRNAQKIMIDVTSAERNKLEQAVQAGQVSREESKIYGVVKPDEEHVLWPFNGEFWRDELGFYRQVVISNCGR